MKMKDITSECYTKECAEWGGELAVYYKDVPLWLTMYEESPIDCGCEIVVDMTEDEDYTEITILGKTPVYGFDDYFDYSTYGEWETMDEANEWLDNPFVLY